ncbi:COP9 signalosome complex subunit 8 [Episyrphus balteatus]|uniref:COP9 signalosome complex subunit 8 n=1 Tax=Episyrphus balteatus TaxID=286459 RepID=UPI0024858C00|nr:COP9 signalosome complex subunit 8 [Episyrphus balteatus]
MQPDKYTDLVKQLEDEELESCINAEQYIQLLAAYLYQDDLSNAKYLWKRIPQSTKTGNKELEKLYTLCLALKNNNTADFFKAISFNWSPAIKDLMTDLEEKIRQDVFTLVGKSYTYIYESKLMELTALPQDRLRQTCESMEWKMEQDAQQQTLVVPQVKVKAEPINTPSEDLLYTLTEFVSFLEN